MGRGEGRSRVWWGDLMRGTPLAKLFETLLAIEAAFEKLQLRVANR